MVYTMSTNLQWILLVAMAGQLSATYPERIDLKNYLQSHEVDRNSYLNPPKDSNLCARQCKEDEEPKICYYKWILEHYATMSSACGNCPQNITECYNTQCVTADGYERGILTVNRQVPGPSIEVCLGDRIIVDVTNAMVGRSTTIHWHGVFQQGSQFMDGVPLLTQCAINEGHTFRYDFYANNEGTHYWHSHDGLQKLDGLQGNLVVRTSKSEDPNGELYDFDLPEHKVFIGDWTRLDADQLFPGLRNRSRGQDADSFLINGRGRTETDDENTTTPYAEFKVEAGKRYRFRIIGGLCTVCPIMIGIQGHNLIVIATDGNPVEPRSVNSIIILAGERYDVVVEANQNPGAYWIHVQGEGLLCAENGIYQLGILQYENAVTTLSEDPGYDAPEIYNDKVLNPENSTCSEDSTEVCPSQLVNSHSVPEYILSQPPSFNYLLSFTFDKFQLGNLFRENHYQRYFVSPTLELLASTVNGISYAAPPAPPLTQPEDVPSSVYCPKNSEGLPICPGNQSFCECVHLITIPLGSVVQLMLSDETPLSGLNHPFHLHGYAFYVMKMAQYEPEETSRDVFEKSKSTVLKQSEAPALKDTVSVPSNGYTIIKFKADNPGYWFLHCHFLYHHVTGMALIIKVGEDTDVPRPPPNFPKCNNFMNDVYE